MDAKTEKSVQRNAKGCYVYPEIPLIFPLAGSDSFLIRLIRILQPCLAQRFSILFVCDLASRIVSG
jgi:hypothetical protein